MSRQGREMTEERRALLYGVGRQIAAERTRRGWNQADLAQRLGVNQNSVSRMEMGEVDISVSMLMALSEAFGLAVEDLLRPVPLAAHEARAEYPGKKPKKASRRASTAKTTTLKKAA